MRSVIVDRAEKANELLKTAFEFWLRKEHAKAGETEAPLD
jgi:hypothetical protein